MKIPPSILPIRGTTRYFEFFNKTLARTHTSYLLRLGVVCGRGRVTLLASSAFVYVELCAERPQRPLFLKNTLKVDTFGDLQ